MNPTIICVLALLVLSACSENKAPAEDTSVAGSATSVEFMSAVDAGKAIVTDKCATCHGMDGKGVSADVPNLAGQHADYILAAAQAYKTDTRKNGVMKENLQALKDTDLINVAAYYASLEPIRAVVGAEAGGEVAEPAAVEQDPGLDPVVKGGALAADCAGCHGENGNSTLPGTPTLAGQPAAYTIAAMGAYKQGERDDEIMTGLAQALSDSDIEYMAAYYAVQIPHPREVEISVPDTAEGCNGCHGENGNSADPLTPSLAGQDAQYLVAATKAYKDGPRSHALMREIVATLSNQEISALATYYAMQEPKPQIIVQRRSAEQWAKICERCHGPGGNSNNPRFPKLAGQSEAYIVNAINSYKQEDRAVSMMHAISWPLDDTDIRNLAAYYSRQPPK